MPCFRRSPAASAVALAGLTIAGVGLPFAAAAGDIHWHLEQPTEGAMLTGVDNVRGWAISSSGVKRVELWIDGVKRTDIPMGGSRRDVYNAFPSYPDAATSGFSMALNYGEMDAGSHSFEVRVVDSDDAVASKPLLVDTSKFEPNFIGDPDSVNLDNATLSIMENKIEIDGLRVGDKSYPVMLEYSIGAQGMTISGIGPATPVAPGSCVSVPVVANGTNAVWDISGSSGGQPVTGYVDTTYNSVSATQADTDTVSEIVIPGFSTSSTTHTVQTYHVTDDMLYVESIVVTGTATAGGFTVPVDSSVTFSPARLMGPWSTFCLDDTWHSPAVSQTIVPAPPGVTDAPAFDGTVESIDDQLSTPAGTFTAVRVYRSVADGTATRQWTDVVSGVMVKQESFSGGQLVQTDILTSLN